MANRIKGEVGFKVDDVTWTLLFDFNALCTIEADLGVSVEDLGKALVGPTAIRSVFRIGLQAKHGEITDREAGDLIFALGAKQAALKITDALKAAFPEETPGNAPRAKVAGTSPAL